MSEAPPKPKGYSYVRMSTDIQLKGDSLRRQLDHSHRYAEEHGIDLDESFRLHDIGVSAFKGDNITGGALGQFLVAVKSGKIASGSYLLVESLDRISRQEVMSSLTVFMDIVKAGINLVTLSDNHVFQAGKTDFQDLIYSIVIMSRAHEESLTKSHRLSAAWSNKRKNVAARKLTRQCPAWLSLSPDCTSFVVDEERAEIVRSVFGDSAAGIGSYSIARRLNQASVKPFGRSKGWQVSYIKKLLTSRATIGEFQPHKLRGKKRIPEGNPIADYFPPIVDVDLFDRVQRSRDARKTGAGGRRGANVSNLFSRVAVCGYCASKMHFINKGRPPKGGNYLVCDKARRGLGCDPTGWRYEHFEASFLAFVKELDLETLVRPEEKAHQRSRLTQAVASLEGKRASLLQKRERTFELVGDAGTPTAFIQQKLSEVESELSSTEVELNTARTDLVSLGHEVDRLYQSKDEIKSLIEGLQRQANEDTYAMRASIAARLRTLVASLTVNVRGERPRTQEIVTQLKGQQAKSSDPEQLPSTNDVLKVFEDRLLDPRSARPFFVVAFQNGGMRAVYPNSDDPWAFDEQVHTVEGDIVRVNADEREETILAVPSQR